MCVIIINKFSLYSLDVLAPDISVKCFYLPLANTRHERFRTWPMIVLLSNSLAVPGDKFVMGYR